MKRMARHVVAVASLKSNRRPATVYNQVLKKPLCRGFFSTYTSSSNKKRSDRDYYFF